MALCARYCTYVMSLDWRCRPLGSEGGRHVQLGAERSCAAQILGQRWPARDRSAIAARSCPVGADSLVARWRAAYDGCGSTPTRGGATTSGEIAVAGLEVKNLDQPDRTQNLRKGPIIIVDVGSY